MNNRKYTEITNKKLGESHLKITIKIGLIVILLLLVLANVITAWALPSISVECCEDFFLNYLDNFTNKIYINLYYLKSSLTFLQFQSDLIFLLCLIKFIFINYDKKFIRVLFWTWFLKVFTDWSFYQHNKQDRTEIFTNYSYFITSQPLSENSLFSFTLAIQFLCFLQLKNQKVLKTIISINLICFCILFLVLKTFFSYQIVFSFVIVDYLKCLVD
jgi:hypothetical protein